MGGQEEINQISNMTTVSTTIWSSSSMKFTTANEISPVSGSRRSKMVKDIISSLRKNVLSTLDWKKKYKILQILQHNISTQWSLN